ncbi:aminotransferase, partial [Streptococcus mutans]|nr:aminotransferase [Streptococcus mutans]
QLMKSLEKLGILTYLYVNEEEEGLSIMPPININLNVLEKALKLISKKIESQNSF